MAFESQIHAGTKDMRTESEIPVEHPMMAEPSPARAGARGVSIAQRVELLVLSRSLTPKERAQTSIRKTKTAIIAALATPHANGGLTATELTRLSNGAPRGRVCRAIADLVAEGSVILASLVPAGACAKAQAWRLADVSGVAA